MKLTIGTIVQLLIMGALLFGPAGTFHWWRAWVFLGLLLCFDLASFAAAGIDPGLLDERMKPPIQAGQPLSDRILLNLFILAYFGSMVFIPTDLFHLHLFPRASSTVTAIGLALLLITGRLFFLVFRKNRFASSVVRHQAERGQRVIDTGPYAVVRHPMYSGFVLMGVGLPLWLGSYAGVLAALVPILVLAVRCVFEERFLARELEGYREYNVKVRYRLVPGLW